VSCSFSLSQKDNQYKDNTMQRIFNCFKPPRAEQYTNVNSSTNIESVGSQALNKASLSQTRDFNQLSLITQHSIMGVEGGMCTAIGTKLIADFIAKPNLDVEQILDDLSEPWELQKLADHQRLYQKNLEDDLDTGGMGFAPYVDAVYFMSEGKLRLGLESFGHINPEKTAEAAIIAIGDMLEGERQGGAIVISYLDHESRKEENHQVVFSQEKVSDNKYLTKAFDPNRGIISMTSSEQIGGQEAIKEALKIYNVSGETIFQPAVVYSLVGA